MSLPTYTPSFYTGAGSTATYSYGFRILQDSDLQVIVTDLIGNETTLALTTDYTVTGAGNVAGGTITLVAGNLTAGYLLSIKRVLALTQPTVFRNQGDFSPDRHEDAIDRMVMIDQQLNEELARCFRAPAGSDGVDLEIPALQAGYAIGVNATADGLAMVANSGASQIADLASTATGKGDALIGVKSDLTGVTSRTQHDKNSDTISAFDFLTPAQIAKVVAYDYSQDLTTPIQTAMDSAWAANKTLFVPAGIYKVAGLRIPGLPVSADRAKCFRMFGEGVGQPFVRTLTGGTILYSTTDAPVMDTASANPPTSPLPTDTGTIEISWIRFEGTSTTPVVKLDIIFGLSEFHHCNIYQAGTGDGLYIGYAATIDVHHCYALNKDWLGSPSLGAARTGVGFNFPISWDSALVTFSKLTSRGFLTGYSIGGAGGVAISNRITSCESSYNYNGILLLDNGSGSFGPEKTVIDSCYFEGPDGGTGILDQGNFTTIVNNLFFPGFLTAIDCSKTTSFTTNIDNNYISLGGLANSTGIKITSNSAFSVGCKTATNNQISFDGSALGVTGILLAGTSSKINVIGTTFNPVTDWGAAAGSAKIVDGVASGVIGFTTTVDKAIEYPTLSQGAISLLLKRTLVDADVAANVMAIPAGSYFTVAMTGATTVNAFSSGDISGRLVVLRATNANCTIASTAYIELLSTTPFTGPGIIIFLIDRIGASNYAYELCRTVF